MLELEDIQGIIFSGYQKKPHARYLLLKICDPAKAKAWLEIISGAVTSGTDRNEDSCINLALSASGLTSLGVDQDTLHTFPLEFREGLAGSETRSRTLGDVGESAPARWAWGKPTAPVHALLMLFARTPELLEELVQVQQKAFEGALICVYARPTESLPDRREHFGFSDGIAQPVIEGSGRESGSGAPSIKAGEFILGYENQYGKLPFVPNAAPALDVSGRLLDCTAEGERKALGRNGSYLVVRQLQQHVHLFWSTLQKAAQALSPGSTPADGAVRLAAKCVGRWPSGAPLVKTPDSDNPAFAQDNEFGYSRDDPDGVRCPIGSHIRRSNPRDSLEPNAHESLKVVDRHRILRRGRSYGPAVAKPWLLEKEDDEQERGLVFICVNANIRRQFEFIQQTWVNNRKFAGLYDERDPLIGGFDGQAGAFTIPADPIRQRLEGLPPFVTTQGGEYFFLPSLRALKFLASLPPAHSTAVSGPAN